ncbi:armadillo repeat-containing protein 4 isoform X1 [Oreochromis aureus]|uniref:Armadillo repeat containing 4 n=1 Tax=Oreochromis aureus TaxID=47969 RepID=A0A668S5Y8_OREAU|nr:armadillo repeat-containing protein 4 isoform X1 [Oreochromis aureus]XP_039472809.1 armadillo repeat-containing protein 4 isoform X1 [Oreochromis aureus]
MGISLTRAAQWTMVSSSTAKLVSTPMNESLLKEILHFVEHFRSQYPQEAEHVFEEPLQWSTTLVASDFKTDYDISDSDVQSHERDSEGHPLLQLSPPTVYVRSFSQLSKLLHLAHDKKLAEVRACLEENREPLVKILGRSFASDLVIEAHDDAVSVVDRTKEEGLSKDLEVKVKLFQLFQDMDKQILDTLLKDISEQVRLNPKAVKNEVEILQVFCGGGDKGLLKSLRYTSDFEFSNGYRAPLWRQVQGDICYLVIEPCDTETLHITCSTAGIFLNGGIKQEGEENGYEQTSDTYEDLVTLLKSRSPHFAEKINQQDSAVQELSTKKEKTVNEQLQLELHTTRRNIYEPRPSGILSTCGKTEENKGHKSSEEEKKSLRQGAKSKIKAEFSASSSPGHMSSQKRKTEENKTLKSSEDEHKNLRQRAKSKTKAELSASSSPGHVSSQKLKTSAGALPGEPFSESSTESEEEEEQPYRHPETNTDLPSEYWQIQKLVKYLKDGDQIVTVHTLCAMMDFNLMQESCQMAIQDTGGLKVLLNLLDTDEHKCKIGSLKILRTISHNSQIRRVIVDMRGVQSIVKILDSPVKELKALAAETIANVAKFRRARRNVRLYGGINKLVKLLDCLPNLASLTPSQEEDIEVACCGALALWSCSRSTKNKKAIRKAGGIPLLGRLLKSPLQKMLIPVVGTLQECASEESYRTDIQTLGMIKDLVRNLSSDNDELQMHCASAIFKCAEDKQTRDLVRKYKGLQPLVSLLHKADNKQLLAAATGAIWKCSISQENVTKFQEYKALEILVSLLTDQPEEVLVNVVGALGEFAQIPANKAAIREFGGIKPLVKLLTSPNQALLVNVTKAVGACATNKDNMVIIDQLDGIRLVWSLLKNPSADVQSSAAWALCACTENAEDAGETARSLIGGFQLIVKLLSSTNNEVLASICAAICKIAKDEENLAILTDFGVVPSLAKLTNTTDDRLRHHLADAIAQCCMWGSNRASFGEAGAVAPLVRYLKSKEGSVQRSTAMALYQLSRNPNNCITMHEKEVVQPLIHMMGSDDEELQEAAAGCVRSIRLLYMANRNAELFTFRN